MIDFLLKYIAKCVPKFFLTKNNAKMTILSGNTDKIADIFHFKYDNFVFVFEV